MTDHSGRILGLGILSAANIAKKNVRAILKNEMGLACHTFDQTMALAEIVAVASRNLSKAEKFIKETGLEGHSTAYGSYEELLQDTRVDAVYVPLPAGLRIEWIKKAAQAGKHIMSEKPIALASALSHMHMKCSVAARCTFQRYSSQPVIIFYGRQTAEATDEVIDACQAANLQWMDGTMWLHNPRARYIKEILSNDNLIGSAQSVLTSFSCDFISELLPLGLLLHSLNSAAMLAT
ncbi:hypothetical protein MMC07_002596 [Pseudocyphellaria aurata]|nr:hypothetical protein [Pseudocyphellaria aurata]